jgi:hypothetical protein
MSAPGALLLETKHKISRLEGSATHSTTMVVPEALLIDCCTGESDISSLIKQILRVFECLHPVFLYVCHDARSAVTDVGR